MNYNNGMKVKETAEEIYKKKDWKRAQELCDAGAGWRGLQARGYNSDAIVWAKSQGLLKFRSHAESIKFSIATGKARFSFQRSRAFKKLMANNGGLRQNAGRCKVYRYHSKYAGEVYLNGTWELQLAVYFEMNNIEWRRNKTAFTYTFKGKTFKYYPDFYLPDSDTYIEVKGYKTSKDTAKWKQFSMKLEVFNKAKLETTIAFFKATKKQVDILALKNTGLSVELTGIEFKKIDKRKLPRKNVVRLPILDWTKFGDLAALVWTQSMDSLGKKLGISGNGIKVYCKRHNIPYPSREYSRLRRTGLSHDDAVTLLFKSKT